MKYSSVLCKSSNVEFPTALVIDHVVYLPDIGGIILSLAHAKKEEKEVYSLKTQAGRAFPFYTLA